MTPPDPTPPTVTPGRLFCFGLGYSATWLARRLLGAGWAVAGTCRSPDGRRQAETLGIDAVVFDGESPHDGVHARLRDATHVLSSVPPGGDGDPVLAHFGEALAAGGDLAWLGYLSTTGVYGNTDGRRVDERAPVAADVERSRHRVAAERAWMELAEAHGLPLQIFRLAGIYGPGRSVFGRIRRGSARRIDKPDHRFSRIHVDDIATVLMASMAAPRPGRVYNVCDNEPAAPAEVTTYACELLGVDPPSYISFEEAAKEMSPMGLSFWKDNRLVDNSRIKAELGVALRYPTYREGLRAVLEQEGD